MLPAEAVSAALPEGVSKQAAQLPDAKPATKAANKTRCGVTGVRDWFLQIMVFLGNLSLTCATLVDLVKHATFCKFICKN
ncbi:hypothetical protein [Comamonas sediminis]|uniref:Uncharacterized protein n=1 Tax=Comamonas sediminis TaxID=1783360 RepID=A0ABV4B305_9BURK